MDITRFAMKLFIMIMNFAISLTDANRIVLNTAHDCMHEFVTLHAMPALNF